MIVEYHRPDRLEDVFELLAREEPLTIPLYGASSSPISSSKSMAVVDLQNLKMNEVVRNGAFQSFGACMTLQEILVQENLSPVLQRVIKLEASYNIRHCATIVDVLIDADGRSPFSTMMLALSAQLEFLPDEKRIGLGDFYPFRENLLKGNLITRIFIPFKVKLAYHYVARTPADVPIVCVGVAQWSSGRTRVALGGFGSYPILGMDGPDASGIEMAARNAFFEADDQWASAEYRCEIAAILAKRCLLDIESDGN